jgi:AraC-type DNA-binding domain-containing proteins
VKSIDPGILTKSVCFSFQPSEFAKEHLKYMTWCGHYYCTEEYRIERETYPYILLVFVRAGKMDISYENKKYTIGKGDVLLMDCMHPHFYHAHNGLEFLYIHFDGGDAHAVSNLLIHNNRGPVFRQEQCLRVGKLLYDCVQFYEAGNVGNMFQDAYLWIDQILYYLTLNSIAEIHEKSPVEQSIQYIQKYSNQNITLEELAGEVSLSSYYLAHIFKKQTGYAPMEYVLKIRLEKAFLLLVHSQKTINEIAYETGYGSPAAFTNIFTRKIGLSPTAYRKLEQGKLSSYRKEQD